MKLLTGRYFWGIDPEYKFKMSNLSKFWRSPALIGSPGSAGYFGLIVYSFIDKIIWLKIKISIKTRKISLKVKKILLRLKTLKTRIKNEINKYPKKNNINTLKFYVFYFPN